MRDTTPPPTPRLIALQVDDLIVSEAPNKHYVVKDVEKSEILQLCLRELVKTKVDSVNEEIFDKWRRNNGSGAPRAVREHPRSDMALGVWFDCVQWREWAEVKDGEWRGPKQQGKHFMIAPLTSEDRHDEHVMKDKRAKQGAQPTHQDRTDETRERERGEGRERAGANPLHPPIQPTGDQTPRGERLGSLPSPPPPLPHSRQHGSVPWRVAV